MDWIHQNKMKTALIVVLLGLNLLTISIIWMQTSRRGEPAQREPGSGASESVDLMKRVLDLSDAQRGRMEGILRTRREQSREYNERLTLLKRQIAEELFRDSPDSVRVRAAAEEIGKLQSEVEMIRFLRFQDLVSICTPEQKEKLRPIVIEVFGRKPPKEEPGLEAPPRREGQEQPPPGVGSGGRAREKAPPRNDDRPAPPSVDEKLARYSERLKLSEEQIPKVRAVLLQSSERGEELRARAHPDQRKMEAAREHIRQEEDENIMKLLNEDQRREFSDMVNKRRR